MDHLVPKHASDASQVSSYTSPGTCTSRLASARRESSSSSSRMPPKRTSTTGEDAISTRQPRESLPAPQKDTDKTERKPTIPPELLAKLMKNFMEDEGTKVSTAATKTVEEYMHLFLTEAVYRAVSSRRDGDPWAKTKTGLMLEVEDLEKITPQLLLDF